MKIELDIPIEEFDYYDNYDNVDGNNVKSFMDIVIDRVAEKMLIEVCGLYKTDIHYTVKMKNSAFINTKIFTTLSLIFPNTDILQR